ncbi:hypothetical protein OAV88_00840 [bacterium]|nr:hypothetical protein [bacterium]
MSWELGEGSACGPEEQTAQRRKDLWIFFTLERGLHTHTHTQRERERERYSTF